MFFFTILVLEVVLIELCIKLSSDKDKFLVFLLSRN